MKPDVPLSSEIVLIGGGHAHALLLRAWGMDPLQGVGLTLVNPTATAPYTGMLPGHVAGHYPRDALEIDLVRLSRFAGARLVFGRVTKIDPERQTLTIPGRPPMAYDYASLDIGITSDMPDLPGFASFGIAAKPLGPFADRWADHLYGNAGPVVVIGGGVAGVELALAMRHALAGRGDVTVVEAAEALRGVNGATADRLRGAMATSGVTLLERTSIAEVGADEVTLADGSRLPATLTVGAAGARPFDWLKETGLALEDGYIAVDDTLRSISHPNVFAVGDCAHLTATPRPKAGVYAVRAAPILTFNLKAAAAGRTLKPFRPQKDFLKLISLGGKRAIADRGARSIEGAWAWTWKDRIDRRFMDRLTHLPSMQPPKLRTATSESEEAVLPLCAGCGAKVSGGALDRVLKQLPSHPRDDVVTGPGDDAAVLRVGGASQVLTTDHLRAFWADPWLFGRIAAIHALGDIWAMGAAPQAALVQVTLPRMNTTVQERWLSEVMAAATDVFTREGASIIGGHSTQGAEFVLGFSVTGLLGSTPVALDRAEAGDALILTRSVGSGTLLAADMALRASGDDLEAALAIMATSQGDAARVLAKTARAMTDVTGFGLAGHAARLARAKDLSVSLDLDAVPFYPGAEHLAAAGIRSSIWQDNRNDIAFEGPDTPRSALLFDPQTAGGFLAAVPEAEAAPLCDKLMGLGHRACLIGRLEPQQQADVIAR